MGDLNEGATTEGETALNLVPLYGANSPLVDAYALPAFQVGNRPGSFQNCSIRNRLDYIFVSQPLGKCCGRGTGASGTVGHSNEYQSPQRLGDLWGH
jgi:hypothetical protein